MFLYKNQTDRKAQRRFRDYFSASIPPESALMISLSSIHRDTRITFFSGSFIWSMIWVIVTLSEEMRSFIFSERLENSEKLIPVSWSVCWDFIQCFLFFRILKYSGWANNIIRRQSNTYVETSEFRIKFPLIKIRHLMPALPVVNRWFRIPLWNLIGLTNVT